jgi:hypothetical protein
MMSLCPSLYLLDGGGVSFSIYLFIWLSLFRSQTGQIRLDLGGAVEALTGNQKESVTLYLYQSLNPMTSLSLSLSFPLPRHPTVLRPCCSFTFLPASRRLFFRALAYEESGEGSHRNGKKEE